MMRKAYIAALAALCVSAPVPAKEFTPQDRQKVRAVYPDAREIYEGCKEAVRIAEGGDLKAFVRTPCAARIQDVYITYMLMTYILDIPSPEDPEGKVVRRLALGLKKSMCWPMSYDPSQPPLLDLRVAKDFIGFFEKHEELITSKANLKDGIAFPIVAMLQSSQYCDQIRAENKAAYSGPAN